MLASPETGDAFLLGVVQGLTEFLPVSSSGHLVLGGVLLGIEGSHLFFDILVHVATLLATVVFYRHSLVEMVTHSVAAARALLSGGHGGNVSGIVAAYPQAGLALMIVLGSVPTAAIGLGFRRQFEAMFGAPGIACVMLLVTAVVLQLSRLGHERIGSVTPLAALLIGTIQGFAIIPGISRSGSTIAAALLLGVKREQAARYSFLLALPAVLGALLLQLRGLSGDGDVPLLSSGDALSLGLGFVAAALTGFVALRVLVPVVKRGRLHLFSYYLVPVGLLGLWFL